MTESRKRSQLGAYSTWPMAKYPKYSTFVNTRTFTLRQPARVSHLKLQLISSPDSMNPQRARRPTAWQVSFPDDMSNGSGGSGDYGGDDEKAEEGAERDLEGLDDQLPVLNGKRKPPSNVDDRVRSLPPLFSPSWLTCHVFEM